MMLAGLPVPVDAIGELGRLVRDSGADDLADRLERTVADDVKLLALTLDERALLLAALDATDACCLFRREPRVTPASHEMRKRDIPGTHEHRRFLWKTPA